MFKIKAWSGCMPISPPKFNYDGGTEIMAWAFIFYGNTIFNPWSRSTKQSSNNPSARLN